MVVRLSLTRWGAWGGQPSISDLRAFVLDRNAYWGDEIALRVFADAFKIVVCVVLQVGLWPAL